MTCSTTPSQSTQHPLHVAAWPCFLRRLVAGRGVAAKSSSVIRTYRNQRRHPSHARDLCSVDGSGSSGESVRCYNDVTPAEPLPWRSWIPTTVRRIFIEAAVEVLIEV